VHQFRKQSQIAASAVRVFAFHEARDAFARLQPPWQKSQVILPPTSLAVGTRVILRTKIGPFWQTIESEHIEYEPGHMFADRMVRGPFRYWLHRHIIEPVGDKESVLIDDITYALPFGVVGDFLGGGFVQRELERLFEFRHEVTRASFVRVK
jgi:ligand-binding SRPBCC domain-containing protein